MVSAGRDNSLMRKYKVHTKCSSQQLQLIDTEIVSEMSGTNSTLTQLISQGGIV
jgi:hypothetical protein